MTTVATVAEFRHSGCRGWGSAATPGHRGITSTPTPPRGPG